MAKETGPELSISDWPIFCSVCGKEFQEGDEFLIVHTVTLRRVSSLGNLASVTKEEPMCLNPCTNSTDHTTEGTDEAVARR